MLVLVVAADERAAALGAEVEHLPPLHLCGREEDTDALHLDMAAMSLLAVTDRAVEIAREYGSNVTIIGPNRRGGLYTM